MLLWYRALSVSGDGEHDGSKRDARRDHAGYQPRKYRHVRHVPEYGESHGGWCDGGSSRRADTDALSADDCRSMDDQQSYGTGKGKSRAYNRCPGHVCIWRNDTVCVHSSAEGYGEVGMLYLKKEMPEKITGIPADVKSEAERKSGCDLSNVKVHYNSTKPADYQAVGIAQKNTIHLAPFHENKIKHEVVHIVQQKQNTFPVCQQRGSVVSDSRLEREANQFIIHNTFDTVQKDVVQRFVVIHGTTYNDYTMLDEIHHALIGYTYRNGLPPATKRMCDYFKSRVYSTFDYGSFPSMRAFFANMFIPSYTPLPLAPVNCYQGNTAGVIINMSGYRATDNTNADAAGAAAGYTKAMANAAVLGVTYEWHHGLYNMAANQCQMILVEKNYHSTTNHIGACFYWSQHNGCDYR